MTNSVSGSQILFAATAADLLPHPVIDNADFDGDRAILTSGDHRYSIRRTGGSYTVSDHIDRSVFSLESVGLGTAIGGAIEMLRDARLREARQVPASARAKELNALKICAARAEDEDTLVLSGAFADHVTIARRNMEAPWLWDVRCGDVTSDAFPVPVVMSWHDLRRAAEECAI